MLRLFSSIDLIAVSQLKDLLIREGIPAVVRNDILGGLSPEIPFTESFPELWIENDSDLQRAQAIKADWLKPQEISGASWTCPSCGESLDAQFTSCWNCGTLKL
jgi:hypothetical protein